MEVLNKDKAITQMVRGYFIVNTKGTNIYGYVDGKFTAIEGEELRDFNPNDISAVSSYYAYKTLAEVGIR